MIVRTHRPALRLVLPSLVFTLAGALTACSGGTPSVTTSSTAQPSTLVSTEVPSSAAPTGSATVSTSSVSASSSAPSSSVSSLSPPVTLTNDVAGIVLPAGWKKRAASVPSASQRLGAGYLAGTRGTSGTSAILTTLTKAPSLDGAVKAIRTSLKAEGVSDVTETTIHLDGEPAHAFSFTATQGGTSLTAQRIVSVHRGKLAALQLTTSTPDADGDDFSAIIKSFRWK